MSVESKYDVAIKRHLSRFKEQIVTSKNGEINVVVKSLAKEMGKDFVSLSENAIYSRVKDILLGYGIKVKMGHLDNDSKDKVLIMSIALESEILTSVEVNRIRREKSAKNKGFRTTVEYENSIKYQNGTCIGAMEKMTDCPLYFGQYIEKNFVVPLFDLDEFYDIGGGGLITKPVDWKCKNGFKIKHVASCLRKCKDRQDYWGFNIYNNSIPDYFILSGWDNRTSLKPEYIWMIKGDEIIVTERTKKPFWDREMFTIYYTPSNILKVEKYEIDKVKELRYMLKSGAKIGAEEVDPRDILKMNRNNGMVFNSI